MLRSLLPEITNLPLGVMARALMEFEWSSMTFAVPPSGACHSLMVASSPPEANIDLSGVMATALTSPRCPLSVLAGTKAGGLQSTTVSPSLLPPVTSQVPSWLNAIAFTHPALVGMVFNKAPSGRLHRFMVLSWLDETRSVPSGLTATSVTPRVCPVSVASKLPSATFHNLMVASALAEATVRPSRVKPPPATGNLCPASVASRAPSGRLHSLTVLSEPPEASRVPLGDWPAKPHLGYAQSACRAA